MKHIIATIGAAGFLLAAGLMGASAAEEQHNAQPHYPMEEPHHLDWSFAGPFGTYDKAQLQRGLKIYANVCSNCHSLNRVAFRDLEELGYSEEQVKSFASNYQVEDGPNDDGEMFQRAATGTDYFPAPYANDKAAAAANNGAVPPDLSLMAKARHVERGFPQFVFDIFTQYAESGPDYIYSLLTGYGKEQPANLNILEGLHYNPYFINGSALAMPQPLYGDDVEYDDGTKPTLDQEAQDVAAFLMWTAEPHLVERKEMGFRVIIFLLVFAAFLYVVKQQVWSRVEH